MMIRYLTYSELIYINGRLLGDVAIMEGKQKIRDIDLLLASEQRPQASAFGEDAYPTIREKSAVLLHSLARNHPFKDGNKRTATVSCALMLVTNGWAIRWDQTEALTMILNVAEGRVDWQILADWLPLTHPVPPVLTPNLEEDKRIIDEIIHEQKWLLDELAKQ